MREFAPVAVGVFLMACTGPEPYFVYPTPHMKELEYVCIHVMQRGTRRFMVNDQKAVIPLQASGSGALPELQTELPPGGYFCGAYDTREVPCSKGKSSNLDGSTCAFSR